MLNPLPPLPPPREVLTPLNIAEPPPPAKPFPPLPPFTLPVPPVLTHPPPPPETPLDPEVGCTDGEV